MNIGEEKRVVELEPVETPAAPVEEPAPVVVPEEEPVGV